MGASDPGRCQGSAECVFYIGVLAKTSSTFSVVATWGSDQVMLLDGVPQAGIVEGAAGNMAKYKLHVAG